MAASSALGLTVLEAEGMLAFQQYVDFSAFAGSVANPSQIQQESTCCRKEISAGGNGR